MKSFKDTNGKEWTIGLTISDAKRVRDLLDVNLLELHSGDPPLLTRLGTDIILLCDVIFVLVKPQADKAGITDEQFGASLGGDPILNAQTALYEELTLFYRSLRRTDMAKAIERQREVIEIAVRQGEEQIDNIDIEAVVAKTLGEASTSLQESAESIPDR